MVRKGLQVAGACTLLFVLAVVATPLPTILSGWLAVSAPTVPVDAIVVLGGGGVRDDGELTDTSLRRTVVGIRLHQRGLAPLLVLGGGSSSAAGLTEAEARRRLARSCDVRGDALLVETTARTTREEASTIARLLKPRGVTTIMLVADAEGMRRASRLFRSVDFEVVPAPVADVGAMSGPENQLATMRRAAIELVALMYYAIAGYL